jgi:hypothetical protein
MKFLLTDGSVLGAPVIQVETVEDAMYDDRSVVTLALASEWVSSTDMLITVQNNYQPLAEEVPAPVTLREARA